MSSNRDASPVRQQHHRQPSPEIDRTSRRLDEKRTDHLPGPRSKEEIREKLIEVYKGVRRSIEHNYGAKLLEPVCWGRLGRTFDQCISRMATEMWVACDFYLYDKLTKVGGEWVMLVLPILYIDSTAVGYQFFIHCCDEILQRLCSTSSNRKNIELALSRKLAPNRVRSWLSALSYVRSAEHGPSLERLHLLNECVKRMVDVTMSGPPSFMDYEWMRCQKLVKRNMTGWSCGATASELASVLYRYDATRPIEGPRDLFPLLLLCAIDEYSSGQDNEDDVEIDISKMLDNLRKLHELGMFTRDEIRAARLWCNSYSHDYYFHSDLDQLLLDFLEGGVFDLEHRMNQRRHPMLMRIPIMAASSSSSQSEEDGESEASSNVCADSSSAAAKPDGGAIAPTVTDA